MARKYRRILTVRGVTAFPVDMLRYDDAWPRTETDSHKIQATWDGGSGPQEIELLTDNETAPNADRWVSFGWQVTAQRYT